MLYRLYTVVTSNMRKHKIIILFLVLIATSSCQNNEIEELKKKISELEFRNSELTDSLNNFEEYKILDSQLIGIP